MFPAPITFGDRQVTARETISDLENVNCGENARYAECDESLILQFFKGKISYDMYINKITNNSTEQEKEMVLLKKDGQLKLNI